MCAEILCGQALQIESGLTDDQVVQRKADGHAELKLGAPAFGPMEIR